MTIQRGGTTTVAPPGELPLDYTFSGFPADSFPARALAQFIDHKFRTDWGLFIWHLGAYEAAQEVLPFVLKYVAATFVVSVALCILMYKMHVGTLPYNYYKITFAVSYLLAILGGAIFIYKAYRVGNRFVQRLAGPIGEETFNINDQQVNYTNRLIEAYMRGQHRPPEPRVAVYPNSNQGLAEIIEAQLPQKNMRVDRLIDWSNQVKKITNVVLTFLALGVLVGVSLRLRSHFTSTSVTISQGYLITNIVVSVILFGIMVAGIWKYYLLGLKQAHSSAVQALLTPMQPPVFSINHDDNAIAFLDPEE